MNRIFSFLLLMSISSFNFAQIGAVDEGHKIELEPFSPPAQDMIAMFEGNMATPFMANDQHQNEIFIGNLKGQAVLLWFWDPNDAECLSQFYDLNTLAVEFEGKPVKIIGFAKGNRSNMDAFLASNQAEFSIIPNAGILGEGPYAGELGYPRMFFLDQSGTIRKVLPAEAFKSGIDALGIARAILQDLSQSK